MKNNYIFTFNNELSIVNELIKTFNPQFKCIINKYNVLEKKVNNYIEQRDLMFIYREEILNLLKKVIEEYKYFDNNAVIYLTGSYARNTVRLFSDLDLNIVYVKGTGKKYMKYEELFYYYICKIFEINRSGVHSIVTAFNDFKNYSYVVNNMDTEEIKITLKDENNNVNYSICGEYKKRYYLQYLNDKNYKTVFNNLIEMNERNGIEEWSNNFLFLNENQLVSKYYKKYEKALIKNIRHDAFYKKYNDLFESSNEIVQFDSNIDIKKFIQMKELNFIYKIIVLLQVLRVNKTNRIYADYKELLNNSDDIMKKMLDKYYEYNYYIYKLNIYFSEKNIPYSIHMYKHIDFDKNRKLKILLNDIINLKEEINEEFLRILKGEMENAIK